MSMIRMIGDLLLLTCTWNRLDIVKLLLTAGASVDTQTKGGRTPLYFGVDQGGIEVVNALLTAGASVNTLDNYGKTPLHLARSIDIVTVLVEAGANADTQDIDGITH